MSTTTGHPSPGSAAGGTSFVAATRLVAEREVKSFLQLKSFWIGLGVTVVALFALSVLPSVFGGGQSSVAVVGTSDVHAALEPLDVDVVEVEDVAAAEELVRSEEVDAAVVPDSTGESLTGVRVVALSDPPAEIVAGLGTVPPVDLLETADVSSGERGAVVLVLSVLFLMFGMGGVAIAQSTVTEKQTRVVEILVSTVPVRALLAGKIVGHTLLTLGQVVVIAVAAPLALQAGGHSDLLTVVLPALGWFVPFMILGFLLLSALWAVTGSLVSRQEDLGATMGLAMMLVMGPYFAVMFFSDNETVMTVLSFVPFSAAVAMPLRMFAGEAAVWEALASLGVLAVTAALVVMLGARLYSGALLQTRGKVALSAAWKHAD
ncbi:ABC transporter permease [Saccharomonospora sp. NB11]|jgi:ABC-2 type transport system permease protein|uniref:ABC transporter permease n=1 Tax=Saccharomonospora sp. NB11 TaxID=1642298 RepID=UPI0018D15D05|nr:ABC transporter permease [Saccharomonospora sp. NB11]